MPSNFNSNSLSYFPNSIKPPPPPPILYVETVNLAVILIVAWWEVKNPSSFSTSQFPIKLRKPKMIDIAYLRLSSWLGFWSLGSNGLGLRSRGGLLLEVELALRLRGSSSGWRGLRRSGGDASIGHALGSGWNRRFGGRFRGRWHRGLGGRCS